MPIDRTGDPWPGVTYNGFSGGPGERREPPQAASEPRRRRSRRPLLIGGVAAALAIGLLFGFWAKPELIGSKSPSTPPTAPANTVPPSAAATGSPGVPIAVNPPPRPQQPPRAPGRLQTLPPEMAAAARQQAQAPAAAVAVVPTPTRAPQPTPAPQPPAADEDVAATADTRASAPAPTSSPAPPVQASFDCAGARPGAEQMVCDDAELATADRQLARAYSRAMRSGVDPIDLRQEQRDWVAIREDAARHSRRAVAEVYDQRIQELNQIAADAPDGE